MKTVLIVDEDLGFVFWLGRILDNAGYEALPAKTVQDAASLLSQYPVSLDLLVINPACPGALEFITAQSSRGTFKILGIFDGDAHDEVAVVDAWFKKPDKADELARLEWRKVIQILLSAGGGDTPETRTTAKP